jgi:Protein of unknown function (DUF1761)
MKVNINYLAVIVAAIVNYALGSLWYGVMFGGLWKKLTGIPEMKPTAPAIVLGIIGAFFMSFILDHAIIFASAYMNSGGIGAGLMCGFWNWLGFIAPVTLGVVIYEKKSWKLWLLNNSYWLVSLLLMGMILAVWK